MKNFITILLLKLLLLSSCSKDKVEITKDYIYYSGGFEVGFTLSLIKIAREDEQGIPVEFNDSLRFDVNNSGSEGIQNQIWFKKPTQGYYWTKQLRGNYDTIPLNFEEGQWYHIWSNNFKAGIFETELHSYLFKIQNGKLLTVPIVNHLNL